VSKGCQSLCISHLLCLRPPLQSFKSSDADFNDQRMIPCSSRQVFQFPGRLIRLPQPQPEFRAPDLDEVGEGEPAVDRGWMRTTFVLARCGLRWLGILIAGCQDWVGRHGSGFAYFDVHWGHCCSAGWTLAGYAVAYLLPRSEARVVGAGREMGLAMGRGVGLSGGWRLQSTFA